MSRRKILLESEYGIYPQPSDAKKEAEEGETLTIEPDLPVAPGPQMAVQLSHERPPIEDDEFVPGSIEELSRSAAAIAGLIPSSQVEFFYKQLHKLLDQANDEAITAEDEIETMDQEEDSVKPREGYVKEESVKRAVRKVLAEMLSSEDVEEFEKYRASGVNYFGEDDPISVSQMPDAVNLEDLASEFGYSGAPGIRQEIERITGRMEHFASAIQKDDLEALKQFALGEYINVLGDFGYLDPDDIVELQQSPTDVQDLDSFRFFFVSAFVLPAYKEASRNASKNVKSAISDLGLPKSLHQTLYNQVVGSTKGGFTVFKRKVDSLVKKGTLSPEEGKKAVSTARSAMSALKLAGEVSDDLVERSLDKWSGMTKKKRETILRRSLEQTSEFQG